MLYYIFCYISFYWFFFFSLWISLFNSLDIQKIYSYSIQYKWIFFNLCSWNSITLTLEIFFRWTLNFQNQELFSSLCLFWHLTFVWFTGYWKQSLHRFLYVFSCSFLLGAKFIWLSFWILYFILSCLLPFPFLLSSFSKRYI